MTIQDLKTNRIQIIETATKLVGEAKVKEVMELMLKFIDESGDDIIAFTELIVEMYFPIKTAKKEAAWKAIQSDASARYMSIEIKNEY